MFKGWILLFCRIIGSCVFCAQKHSVNILVDMSTKSCCTTVGRHVDRYTTDIPPIPHRYLRTGDCNLSHRHNLTLVSDFCWAAQISLIYPSFLRGNESTFKLKDLVNPTIYLQTFCILIPFLLNIFFSGYRNQSNRHRGISASPSRKVPCHGDTFSS